jgi:hypothetical protein
VLLIEIRTPWPRLLNSLDATSTGAYFSWLFSSMAFKILVKIVIRLCIFTPIFPTLITNLTLRHSAYQEFALRHWKYAALVFFLQSLAQVSGLLSCLEVTARLSVSFEGVHVGLDPI